jgi:hypothetical protein
LCTRRAGEREAPGLSDDLKRGEEAQDLTELLERAMVGDVRTEAVGRMKERRRGRQRREEDRLAGGGGDWRRRLGLVGCGGGWALACACGVGTAAPTCQFVSQACGKKSVLEIERFCSFDLNPTGKDGMTD